MKRKKLALMCLCFLSQVFAGFGQLNNNAERFSIQANQIFNKLISVIDSMPQGMKWPPVLVVVDKEEINAFASVKDGKPQIVVHSSLDRITSGIKDRLAYIIAHEIAHLYLGHHRKSGFSTDFAEGSMFTRANEEEADLYGLKIFLKAGYSYLEAIVALKAMKEKLGDYSPLEAQSVNHPSWSQRLAYIDKAQAKLWNSMSAFSNGVTLLFTQNYEAAVVCFQKVTREFPGCYEAFFNLGYAMLMQYCDLFDEEDIRYFKIGQIVAGGFYRRPESLEVQIRGVNEELWWNAIGNFREALRINPELSLAKAYLGLAYYLDPRKQNAGLAEKFFDEALKMVKRDDSLDPVLKASVYLNSGALDMAHDNFGRAAQKLDSARMYKEKAKKLYENGYAFRSNWPSLISYPSLLEYAIEFNGVVNTYRADPGSASVSGLKTLLRYLRNTDPASIWWKVAYSFYAQYALTLRETPLPKEMLTREIITGIMPVQSITVDKFPVYLSQDIQEVLEKFPDFIKIPVVEERRMARYLFPEKKIEIIAGREILMIIIKQNNPSVKPGIKKSMVKDLTIGMPFEQVKSRFENLLEEKLTVGDKTYLFYYESGVGFLLGKSGQIAEILISMKPTENRP